MIVVGVTGGIGSGKSTVAGLLVGRGAVLIDADEVAREVVEPGRPAYAKVVGRFGGGVVAADGSLDRSVIARMSGVLSPPPSSKVSARARRSRGPRHTERPKTEAERPRTAHARNADAAPAAASGGRACMKFLL